MDALAGMPYLNYESHGNVSLSKFTRFDVAYSSDVGRLVELAGL